MATNGKISEQSDAVQKWFEFVKSDEGAKIIKKQGLIVPDDSSK